MEVRETIKRMKFVTDTRLSPLFSSLVGVRNWSEGGGNDERFVNRNRERGEIISFDGRIRPETSKA